MPSAALALRLTVDPPARRQFIADLANMISDGDEQQIRQVADTLLTDKATPIIVVTIESMAAHSGEGLRIETFATLLFDQWQIGHAELHGQAWNTGILLLVSKGDRKARIELGAGWGHDKDELCDQIMQEQIISRFEQGEFSAGIRAGVEALDRMAREKSLPATPKPASHYVLIIGVVLVGVLTVVSLFRSGTKGWAWVGWGLLFTVIGTILYQLAKSSGRGGGGSSGGGGFSGGSFGGGFSGGGGATGSW